MSTSEVAFPIPRANRLLSALPAAERERLLTACETVELVFPEVLAEPGDRLVHAYFPTGGVISMVTPVDGRPGLEVGLIGDEGMLGASMVLGVRQSPALALVQGAGSALRITASAFLNEIERCPGLQRVLKRYVHVTIEQIAQTAACTRFHRVEQRLARWLLMTHDRAYSPTFDSTHEFLAFMLGVRRVGITAAACALQHRKLIRYRRGHITIVDRAGLETTACACYTADRATYARIMEGRPLNPRAGVAG